MTLKPGDRVHVEYPGDDSYHLKRGTVIRPRGELTEVRFDEDIPGYPVGTICNNFATMYLVMDENVIEEDDVA